MSRISDERIAEMLACLEGVTPGPWFADQWGDGSGGDDWIVCAPNIEAVPVPAVRFKDDACHIANCDPDTIRAILNELQARRASTPVSEKPVAFRYRERGTALWSYAAETPARDEWGLPDWEVHPLYLHPSIADQNNGKDTPSQAQDGKIVSAPHSQKAGPQDEALTSHPNARYCLNCGDEVDYWWGDLHERDCEGEKP